MAVGRGFEPLKGCPSGFQVPRNWPLCEPTKNAYASDCTTFSRSEVVMRTHLRCLLYLPAKPCGKHGRRVKLQKT